MITKSMVRVRVGVIAVVAVVCATVAASGDRQPPAASGARAPGISQPAARSSTTDPPVAPDAGRPGEQKKDPGRTNATSQPAGKDAQPTSAKASDESGQVPEPHQTGGEADSVVQVANLVYAGTKSSRCFSDHFLVRAEKESAISTSRRFHAVKLGSEELFCYPLVIMTGEGTFRLSDEERETLKNFVERGGFLLASAGCSSAEWDRAFRSEMATIFPDHQLKSIGMDHAVFHTVYDVKELHAKQGQPRPLEGISIGARLGVLYSQDGLNDTTHATGCCCCGGNEITNAEMINVNILAYALVY